MGEAPSKPDRIDDEELMAILDRRPKVLLKYFEQNTEMIEKYIGENFWEEDVERWLNVIRNRCPKEKLQVRKVNFLKAKNKPLHHTENYEHASLVIRRADHFDLDVFFGNRPFEKERDDISIVFKTGPKPSELSKTKITCAAAEEAGDGNQWNCKILSVDDQQKKLSLRVNVPSNAFVARYSVSLEIISGVTEGREQSEFRASDVIVLFNPFSKDDTVYMENQQLREEYVMNDTGFVVVGSALFPQKRPWTFAQFDEGVLDAVLLMLQKDSRAIAAPVKAIKGRSSPVYVSRVLAAMVNCNDDKGVLYGKWDGAYDDGASPISWDDSRSILSKWAESGMSPVKYGQCWVFSAVLTTAMRALGIPARSVTNFNSAHDTDGNQTIDIYYDVETDKKMKETSDSIWNFHVWNEAYFRRKDLPEGYDGWQVVDATPQEVSEVQLGTTGIGGLMQCGPAPVKAVKEGEIRIGYDTGFIFSEVNADVVKWLVGKGKILAKLSEDPHYVGKRIATKAVGKNEIEFITDQYKFREGSEDERFAFRKAYGLGDKDELMEFSPGKDYIKPEIEITLDHEPTVEIGKDVSVNVKVKNVSLKEHKVDLALVANSKTHTGRIHRLIKKVKNTIVLGPKKETQLTFKIQSDEYVKAIVDNFVVEISARATSTLDGNTSVDESDVQLVPPTCISLQNVSANEIFWADVGTFDVELENVTPMKLTNGVFVFDGRGIDLDEAVGFELSSPIEPGEKYYVRNIKVRPKDGWRRVNGSVSFHCTQITGIREAFKFKVKY